MVEKTTTSSFLTPLTFLFSSYCTLYNFTWLYLALYIIYIKRGFFLKNSHLYNVILVIYASKLTNKGHISYMLCASINPKSISNIDSIRGLIPRSRLIERAIDRFVMDVRLGKISVFMIEQDEREAVVATSLPQLFANDNTADTRATTTVLSNDNMEPNATSKPNQRRNRQDDQPGRRRQDVH